jgi:hypothetical protein
MRSFASIPLLVALLVGVASSEAGANAGDPRVVQGVLAWSPGAPGAPFVVVRADDGRHYVADLTSAQRRGDPVNVGDRISLVGVEGARPWEVSTLVMGSGDSALAGLAPPPASPSAAPATRTPPLSAPAESPATAPRPWRRIHGRVDSVADKTLRLRDVDGRSVTVDVSRLIGNVKTVVRPGDYATVFVVAEAGDRLVAVGFVQSDGAEGSASPRLPR